MSYDMFGDVSPDLPPNQPAMELKLPQLELPKTCCSNEDARIKLEALTGMTFNPYTDFPMLLKLKEEGRLLIHRPPVFNKMNETKQNNAMFVGGKSRRKVVQRNGAWKDYHKTKLAVMRGQKVSKQKLIEAFACENYTLTNGDRKQVLRNMKMERIYQEMTKQSPIKEAKKILTDRNKNIWYSEKKH